MYVCLHFTSTGYALYKKVSIWVNISVFDGVAKNLDIVIFIKTVVRPIRRDRYGELEGCDRIPIATPSWTNYFKIELSFHLKLGLNSLILSSKPRFSQDSRPLFKYLKFPLLCKKSVYGHGCGLVWWWCCMVFSVRVSYCAVNTSGQNNDDGLRFLSFWNMKPYLVINMVI